MSLLLIRQCECKVLFRVRYLPDVHKQIYVCGNCRREIELIGTIVDMYVCKVNSGDEEREWVAVPPWRIQSCGDS